MRRRCKCGCKTVGMLNLEAICAACGRKRKRKGRRLSRYGWRAYFEREAFKVPEWEIAFI